ncbi:hypothetical protein WMF31_36590 [Sorangium sp. So ce1036]|uniref:hypothetical protein n=1 Tax=Sorangium sp. So ce1036 TaxID=3133328 RepID=UPI003F10227C
MPLLTGAATRRTSRRGALGALLVACLVAGCAGTRPFQLGMKVRVARQANRNSPVPVTLLAVYDPKLFERISAMSAKQWYEQREQLHRDFPSGDGFTEWQWEFVPGYNPRDRVVRIFRQASIIMFANYRSPGAHRVRLGPYSRILVNLEEEDFTVTTLSAAEGAR